MSLLTKAQILGSNDLQAESVPVPEWGGEVRVRALSGADRVKIAQLSLDAGGEVNTRQALDLLVLIPAMCIVDEHGQRIFSEDDVAALGEKHGDPLQRIMEAALRLSNLDLDDLKKG